MQINKNGDFGNYPSRQSSGQTRTDSRFGKLIYAPNSQDYPFRFRCRTRLSFKLSTRPSYRRHRISALFYFIQPRRRSLTTLNTRFPCSKRPFDPAIPVLNRRRRARMVDYRSKTNRRLPKVNPRRYHSPKRDERVDPRSLRPSLNICIRYNVRRSSRRAFEILWPFVERTRRYTGPDDTKFCQIRPLQNYWRHRRPSIQIGKHPFASSTKSSYRNSPRLVGLFCGQITNPIRCSGVLA